ncbi:cutinase [Melampsora larici-populina 98AG31]|uniref:Cutinase n=1 Tax=Melampsora larici-populina (strain 98AG31 / pathotype 3-4-7) TaxID=747676 RepID=F4RL14_MELLP|nr:cutinase [Melampsora larici-populina 98AG31]EGG06822.1 cutinase [Melampsora larici-populina 98AG31]
MFNINKSILFQLSIYTSFLIGVLSALPSNEIKLEKRTPGMMPNFLGIEGGNGVGGEKRGSAGHGESCKKYKIISARGTGESQGGGYLGYSGTISGILKAVPNGGNYEVKYPATADYLDGPIQGSNDALKYILEQKKLCPKQVYVLIGYSEGAMVMTQLANKPNFPGSSIVAIAFYGNPYFKGGAPQNACSAKTGSGVASATGISLPSKFSKITFDCCQIGDMICQTSGTIVAHLTYTASESEKSAVKFVVGKLQSLPR